jgi:SAM-dependent methyltransferase
LAGIAPGSKVLDVGCGDGALMRDLAGAGCDVSGVEINPSLVAAATSAGLRVALGRAEELPVPDASFDVILCSVVLPYTDERLAVAEWARVLRPGGVVNASCHGLGYGLTYMFRGCSLKQRYYGFRMLANTAFYQLARRRLPGSLGDTLCQTGPRLRAYYAATGLVLEREQVVDSQLGLPRFLCHRLRKPGRRT